LYYKSLIIYVHTLSVPVKIIWVSKSTH